MSPEQLVPKDLLASQTWPTDGCLIALARRFSKFGLRAAAAERSCSPRPSELREAV